MEFLPADWGIAAAAVFFTVFGLFRGLSGAIAFGGAIVVAAAAAVFSWEPAAGFIESDALRMLAVFAAALVVFGLVRLVVKKIVKGIVSQPSDSIFGGFAGLAAVAGLVAVWAYSGMWLEYSAIAAAASSYVR